MAKMFWGKLGPPGQKQTLSSDDTLNAASQWTLSEIALSSVFTQARVKTSPLECASEQKSEKDCSSNSNLLVCACEYKKKRERSSQCRTPTCGHRNLKQNCCRFRVGKKGFNDILAPAFWPCPFWPPS